MRLIRLSTVFGVALSCVLGNPSVVLAQTAQTPSHDVSDLMRQQGTPTVYEYCSSVTPQSGPGGQRVFYYSGVFGGPYTALSGADKAFVQFLEQKYSFKSGGNNAKDAVCGNSGTEAQARGNEQSSLNSTRQHNQAVETGWTYSVVGSAGAAASATSPAQAARPNEGPAAAVSQRYGYCYAQAPSGWYFSAPLSAAGAGGGDIAYYFHHFLIAKFGVQQEVRCQITFVWHSLADVQTYLQRAEDAQHSYGKNVIETGWTYSGARPAGAVTSAPTQPTTSHP